MYSGFITSKRTMAALGVHQRLDTAAYRITAPFFADGGFPPLKEIIHFEGINGPDGLKVKSPGQNEPGHLYNPETGAGDIPRLIEEHYNALITRLGDEDETRAAFEASWMAHYICDGLTPAHHFPLDTQLAEHAASYSDKPKRYKHAVIVKGDTAADAVKRSWAVWGGKGLLSTHFNFEIGIAAALVGYRIKLKLDDAKLAKARSMGALAFFEKEAKEIAELKMYEQFYAKGWNAKLARTVKNRLAPQIAQTIGIIWLLAYLEAGQVSAKAEVNS